MIGGTKELILYETSDGKVPFQEWLEGLSDRKGRAIIRVRLDRLEYGNPGACRQVGEGVSELRIHYGPGYRVYFGEDGKTSVVLLNGGDKSTQRKDILRAQKYWVDHWSRK